uniref:glucuronosyltransferase n=1 Tax=Caenorhabditis tropicalis TaxID=1561998 RepID=A0A1I7U6S5_9PELO
MFCRWLDPRIPLVSALIDYLNIKSFALANSIAFESSSLRAIGETFMPSHIPDILAQSSDQMTLNERFLNSMIQLFISYYRFSPDYFISYDDSNRKIYPSVTSFLLSVLSSEIFQLEFPKSSFLFTNSNPYLDFPRAILSKNVPIGGISVDIESLRNGKLGEEWDQILNIRNKTILISFGSVTLSKDMPFEYKVSLANSMKRFPDVTFIWKYEDDDIDSFAQGIENIYFSKWVPQKELLADPRVSAFMTHAGLGSVNEVSYLGKPTIMCPLMSDQMRNAKMLARHNGSIEISKYDLINGKILEDTFRKILYDDRYLKSAKRLSEQLEFQPTKPKDLFLKHAEFAAR